MMTTRPILPTPNRVKALPPLEQLPIFDELLNHSRYGVAVTRLADRLGSNAVDVTLGLLYFFSELETSS
jgi:hypothetical protein